MHSTTKKTLLVLLSVCSAACLSVGVAACQDDATPPAPEQRYENPQTQSYTATVESSGKKISDVVVTWTNRNTGLVAAVAHTDADGVATCNIVPAEYSVTIVGYSTTLYANKGGARFADSETTSVTFELTEIVTSTYTAYVEAGAAGLEGAGIAWVNMATGEIAATVLTDSDGNASAVLETGDYYVILEEYSESYVNTQGTQTATAASPRIAYSLTPVSGAVGRPTFPYYAYVNAGSSHVEGVSVVFYDEDVPVYANYTDENGSVRANITNGLGASGKYTVRISGYTALGYTTTVDTAEVTTENDRADFELARSITASNSYDIKVTSQGGMALRGVTVNLVKNGETVASGVTNSSGKASIFCEFGSYDVTFVPPTGFYTDDGADYTVSQDVHDYTFSLKSSVINSTAPANKVYAIGDVMYDFSVRDAVTNESLVLSELLSDYKAVVLNFWYIGCSPCRMEFPYIQAAYEDYKDKIAFVALTSQDSVEQVKQFKNGQHPLNGSNVYTFNMGYDSIGLTQQFSVGAYPTTVVIDRYSVVAYATSGNDTSADSWKNMFETYVSDNYTQDINQAGPGNNQGATDRERPDKEQDAFDETYVKALANDGMALAASQLTGESDDAYSWPFNTETVRGEKVISATNVGHESSYSILYVNDLVIKKDKALVFDYDLVTKENSDILYVLVDRHQSSGKDFQIYASLSGAHGDVWNRCVPFVATDSDATISLAFCYRKGSGTSPDNEHVYIKNLNVVDVQEASIHTDVRHDAATGDATEKEGYANYITPVFNENDGFYHVGSADGPILYVDMLSASQYSRLHVAPSATYSAIYYISRNVIGVEDDAGQETIAINGHDYTAAASRFARNQGDSDNRLLPVTKEIYDYVQVFLAEITSSKYNGEYGTATYENQWLEFCCYFVHYGEAGDERCDAYDDPTVGLNMASAIEIAFSDKFNGLAGYSEEFAIDDNRGLNIWRGTRTRFTAPATGVYSFYGFSKDSEVDPYGYILNPDNEDRIFVECTEFLGRKGIENGFMFYAYLRQGETLYLVCAQALQSTGIIDLKITYEATSSLNVLTSCDLGLGLSSYHTDEEGNKTDDYYLAIPVMLGDDGYYYSLIRGEMGSKIYLDFFTENVLLNQGVTIKSMLDNGGFNLIPNGGQNYTDYMQNLYNQAVSRDRSDPLYGLAEVNEQTARILHQLLVYAFEKDNMAGELESNRWLAMCWYIQTVSAEFRYHSA